MADSRVVSQHGRDEEAVERLVDELTTAALRYGAISSLHFRERARAVLSASGYGELRYRLDDCHELLAMTAPRVRALESERDELAERCSRAAKELREAVRLVESGVTEQISPVAVEKLAAALSPDKEEAEDAHA